MTSTTWSWLTCWGSLTIGRCDPPCQEYKRVAATKHKQPYTTNGMQRRSTENLAETTQLTQVPVRTTDGMQLRNTKNNTQKYTSKQKLKTINTWEKTLRNDEKRHLYAKCSLEMPHWTAKGTKSIGNHCWWIRNATRIDIFWQHVNTLMVAHGIC